MKVDPSLIHRLFYPQVPLVMSAQSARRVSAMPVVSYASISELPPLVAVACNPRGFTCKLALKSRAFSLSVLARPQVKALSILATVSGAKVQDKLAEAGLKHHAGKSLPVPVLEGAAATLECEVETTKEFGDHVMLIGSVRNAHASHAFKDFWDFGQYRPILYTGWQDGLTTYDEPIDRT